MCTPLYTTICTAQSQSKDSPETVQSQSIQTNQYKTVQRQPRDSPETVQNKKSPETRDSPETDQRQSRDSPETVQNKKNSPETETETVQSLRNSARSNVHDSSVLKSEQFALYIWEKVMTVSNTVSDIAVSTV